MKHVEACRLWEYGRAQGILEGLTPVVPQLRDEASGAKLQYSKEVNSVMQAAEIRVCSVACRRANRCCDCDT